MEDTNLKRKYKDLLNFFGGKHKIKPSISELRNYFKDRYVDTILEGRKCVINLTTLRKTSTEWKKKFKEDWQVITITYRRLDIVFFTWDNYPEYGEEYLIVSDGSVWTRYVYPQYICLSEIFGKKIETLKNNNINELRLQVSLVEFDNLSNKIDIYNDISNLLIEL